MTQSLIGKTFKYNSKYGLSDWTDTIAEITFDYSYHKDSGHFMAIPRIKGKAQWYTLDEIVIVDFKHKEIFEKIKKRIKGYKGLITM